MPRPTVILAVALLLGGAVGPALGQGASDGRGAPAAGATGSAAVPPVASSVDPAGHGAGTSAAAAGQPPAPAPSAPGPPPTTAAVPPASIAPGPATATVAPPASPASPTPAPAVVTPSGPATAAAAPVPPLPAPPSTTRLQLSSVLGRTLTDPAGESVGRIVDVLVDVSGQPKAAVIDFGGFMGLGSRRIAVTWDSISFPLTTPSAQVRLSLTPDQIRSTPEYTGMGLVVTVVGPPSQAPTPGP